MFTQPARQMLAAAALAGVFLSVFGVSQMAAAQTSSAPMHAMALHGAPKYGPDFTHFEYVNPDAPKGGDMRLASLGTFDTLNPYTLRGEAAPGLSLTFQSLLNNADDEAFTEYGQIAESIEMPEDRSSVTFNLRTGAKFHDGKPLTAADVVWTFQTLMEKGHPFYRSYYNNVKEAKAETPHRVTFVFNMAGNRELPLIMGQMPVLPKHAFEGKDFSATTLTPVVGSGPYKIKSVDPGRRIVYERVKDWWAKDLPVNRGQYNFDTITFDAFLDETVQFQAFFTGAYDIRQETSAKAWKVEYDGQRPVKRGLIRKEEIVHSLPAGMQAFVLNTRRAAFADAQTRAALNYAFDFEWSNRQMAYGSYTRTNSYFANSELAASGLPQGRELEILDAYRGKIPDEVFTQEYKNPVTSGSGNDMRAQLAKAREMLEAAGWKMGKNKLLEKDGKEFRFEILVNRPIFERWVNPFIGNLKRLGIAATLRVVDTAQYQKRMDDFDFDVAIETFGQSLSPGNEQLDFWGSAKADVKGSRNLMGIKNPVIDDLIQKLIAAPDREELLAVTRALDRVLLWNHYVIPQWHSRFNRVAYWDKFGHPEKPAKYNLGIVNTWWYDAQKAAELKKREGDAAGGK